MTLFFCLLFSLFWCPIFVLKNIPTKEKVENSLETGEKFMIVNEVVCPYNNIIIRVVYGFGILV